MTPELKAALEDASSIIVECTDIEGLHKSLSPRMRSMLGVARELLKLHEENERRDTAFEDLFIAYRITEHEAKELRDALTQSQARVKELEAEVLALREVMEAARQSSKWLDNIKFELCASVYTLTDDEFETVFEARDNIDLALDKLYQVGD